MLPVGDAPARHALADTYDRIATHFAATRQHPWSDVCEFIEGSPPGARGLDIGCGNGRHLDVLGSVANSVVGLDLSQCLLAHAQDEQPHAFLVRGDAVELPFRTNVFDICLYVATLHHLPTRAERHASLAEVARVLKPDGRCLVSCWAVTHQQFDFEEGQDRWIDWTLPDGRTVPRFYHIFDPAEFTDELQASALAIEATWVSGGNCYAVGQG